MKQQLLLYFIAFVLRLVTAFNHRRSVALELAFLDVGQGDAILITTPKNNHVLIDGGAGFEVSRLMDSHFPLNNCTLEAVFLTHPHADHLEGLSRIMDHCNVKTVFSNRVEYPSLLYSNWEEKLYCEQASFSVLPFMKGDSFTFDGITLWALWPDEDFMKGKISNINDSSIVLFLDFGDFEAFLPGDAEVEPLKELELDPVLALLQRPLEVYKSSHHGSITGHHPALWQKLAPDVTVISVGEGNSFGHPSDSVLEFYAGKKALVKRTDMDGTVKIRYNLIRND